MIAQTQCHIFIISVVLEKRMHGRGFGSGTLFVFLDNFGPFKSHRVITTEFWALMFPKLLVLPCLSKAIKDLMDTDNEVVRHQ